MALWAEKKRKCWVWIAIEQKSKQLLAFQLGSRGQKNGKQLYAKIERINCKHYYTDYWKAYTKVLPADKHTASKKQTYTIEGYNSLLIHYLARFKRKTKCYSKTEHMIEVSLNLLFHKLNTKNNCYL